LFYLPLYFNARIRVEVVWGKMADWYGAFPASLANGKRGLGGAESQARRVTIGA
jgi:hypothetical protein